LPGVTDAHELGPLEIRVLEQFAPGQSHSVAEIRQLLQKAGHDLAYTTVMTVLGRLHAKRVLLRKKDGKRYQYSISNSSKRASSMLSRLHQRLFGVARLAPVTALLNEADVSTEELTELRRLIDAKLKARVAGRGSHARAPAVASRAPLARA
jgi:BlaI family transcriptional regulator, penicillinase repressor